MRAKKDERIQSSLGEQNVCRGPSTQKKVSTELHTVYDYTTTGHCEQNMYKPFRKLFSYRSFNLIHEDLPFIAYGGL